MDNLANLAPEDAFRLAVRRSGQTLQGVIKKLGWSESYTRRVMSTERYFPSYEILPDFCEAVGNTIILQWLEARTRHKKEEQPKVTPDYLRDQVMELSTEFGDVASRIKDAVADGRLTKLELRAVRKEVMELVAFGHALAGALGQAEKAASNE